MKRTASLFFALLTVLTLSCSKEEDEGGNNSSAAVLGVSVKDLPEVVEVPEHQTLTYELTVTADPGPSAVLNVTAGTDESLVAKYNLANGTSYKMLPSAAYEISSTPLMLMRYNKTSSPGTIKFKGEGCETDQTYLLPLVVDKVEGDATYEISEDKALYVLFTMLEAQVEGAGTEVSPYLISDAENFNKIGNMLKDGETVYIKLEGDIDLEGKAWTTIDATGKPVSLDGGNHKIMNVAADCGLFSVLEGTVMNLTIENAVITAGAQRAGVLASTAGGEGTSVLMKNVNITSSSITNTGYTGGLLGSLVNGTVEDVTVDVDVEGVQRTAGLIGHLVSGTLLRCVASGDVTSTDYYAGGLVAMFAEGSITECSATGNVTNTKDNYSRAGGLVGQMFGGNITRSHATGNVSGLGHYAGGLVGVIDGSVTEKRTVNGSEVNYVVDHKNISITSCYATGNVPFPPGAKDNKSGSGGLIGITEGGNITISDCYSTGAVGAYRWSGGFVGNIGNAVVTIKNGYTSSDCSDITLVTEGVDQFGLVIGARNAADASVNKHEGTATCTGFVAWNLSGNAFCFPADVISTTGNYYGTDGSISSQAALLGWDAGIWDLSGDIPELK